ncbi:MAG: MFS transporter [Spirochaetota bacterium]
MIVEPRGYPLLLAGNIVSTFGSSIYVVTLVLYLADATDSAATLGLLQFLAYLPAALLGPVAGALVDHWNRKLIIVWTDLARAAIMLTVAAIGVLATIPVWLLMVATVAVSVAGVLFVPAVHALVPALVAPTGLRRANGTRSAGTQIANLAGSAIGGALYVLLGAPLVILANGVSFLLSGVSETAIRPRIEAEPEESYAASRAPRARLWARTREGFAFLLAHREIRSLVLVQALVNLLLPPLVVALPFVIGEIWELSPEYFGYMFATVLGGGIVGFVVFSRSRANQMSDAVAYRSAVVALATALSGLAVLTVPVTTAPILLVPLLLLVFFIAGGAVAVVHMIGVTRLQQTVAVAMRGRVFAAMETLTAILLPAAYMVSGLLAEAVRDSLYLLFLAVAVGAALLAVSVIVGLPTPGVRKRGRRKW